MEPSFVDTLATASKKLITDLEKQVYYQRLLIDELKSQKEEQKN
jgi:hypothetical protein